MRASRTSFTIEAVAAPPGTCLCSKFASSDSSPAVRDAFVLTLTGHDTFVDKNSLLRGVLEKSYEIRAMLVNPMGTGLRTRVDTLPQDMTLLSLHGEIEASIAYLARLRKLGKKVTLKFYEDDPFWKVIVLGDHVWVQHFHSGFPANQQPEYVFALQHRDPRQGLFVPFYMHFLDRWNEPHHPAYDFDTGELVYRDSTGNESRRLPLGMSMNGTIPPVGASPPDRVPTEARSGKDLACARAGVYRPAPADCLGRDRRPDRRVRGASAGRPRCW